MFHATEAEPAGRRAAPPVPSGLSVSAAARARTERVVLQAYLNPRDLRTRSLLEVMDRLAESAQGLTVGVEVIDATCASARIEQARLLAVPTILRVRPRPPVRVIGWFDSPVALAQALQLPGRGR